MAKSWATLLHSTTIVSDLKYWISVKVWHEAEGLGRFESRVTGPAHKKFKMHLLQSFLYFSVLQSHMTGTDVKQCRWSRRQKSFRAITKVVSATRDHFTVSLTTAVHEGLSHSASNIVLITARESFHYSKNIKSVTWCKVDALAPQFNPRPNSYNATFYKYVNKYICSLIPLGMWCMIIFFSFNDDLHDQCRKI